MTSRYGLIGGLDHRSYYGNGWFPEPFRADEFDVDRELRLDWVHAEKRHHRSDDVRAEVEYNIGVLTFEVGAGYEKSVDTLLDRSTGRTMRDRSSGPGSVELAARLPVYQYVSPDGRLDYTLGVGLELALPTRSQVSRDTEVVPRLIHLLRLGEHFSVQAAVGLSTLIGAEARGEQVVEYNAVVGYNIEHRDLPIPGVMRTIPILELIGERALNHADAGKNILTGTLGVRFNLKSVGPGQPRLGFGYVFPIDKGGRDELRWGVVTSLVFEF